MKKQVFLIVIFFAFFTQIKAQNYDLPPNPKPGKCYEKCFDYNKEFKWKEVDCEKLKAKKNRKKTKAELLKYHRQKIKLQKYQEKLKSLGYNVEITGVIDNKTIIAHHLFLKRKKKQK